MRRRAALAALLAAALALGACSVETTSSDPGSQSRLDDGPGDLLREPGAARRGVVAIEQQVGASPARVRDVVIYPEYLDTQVQDPAIPEHIDEYEFRGGQVVPPEPVHLTGPQEEVEASLFPTTSVDWREIPDMVRRAERAAKDAKPVRIEDARANYLIVNRSTSPEDDGRVELTIYLGGPRRSGRAELSATGDIVTLVVD